MADEMKEVGVSGLKATGGIVTEEWLADLRGKNGRTKYREMADNDPIIGGMMLGIQEIVSRLDWRMEAPDDPTPQELEAAQFVEECRIDMSMSWDAIIGDILTMSVYGWSFLEVVYKRRVGPYEKDPINRSKFTDGRIGWRKWALRSQETLEKWEMDEHGGIQAMIQSSATAGKITIPIERALLFRTSEAKNNPEGRSLLRNAYRPWFFRKRIEEFEAIGVERDLAGLPVVYAPAKWYTKEATKEERDSLDALKNIVSDLRRNDAEGVLLPDIRDKDGNRALELTLLNSGGARQFDTSGIIQRYTTQIASSLLMDFLTLGHEGTGSYSLGAAKIELWHLTVEAIAKSVASVVNSHAIPRLLQLNGMTVERMPELRFGDIAQADLSVVGKFLADMIDRGVIMPDEDLEDWTRTLARMPARSDSTAGPAAESVDDPTDEPETDPDTPANPDVEELS